MESTDPGRAVIEDLVRAALPDLVDARADGTPTIDLGTDDPAARHVAAFLVFALGVVTLLAAAIAYAAPGPLTLGLLLVLAAATGVAGRTWRQRAATVVTATGSRLAIERHGSRYVFDLASPRSAVDVVGTPGEPGWRVLFYRRGMAPYQLDGARVDTAAFMRVLTEHRPEVHYRPQ